MQDVPLMFAATCLSLCADVVWAEAVARRMQAGGGRGLLEDAGRQRKERRWVGAAQTWLAAPPPLLVGDDLPSLRLLICEMGLVTVPP